MRIFYEVWVDAIIKIRSRPQNAGIWKFYCMIFMSMAMALNLWFLSFVLMLHAKITLSFFPIPIDIFPGTRIDAFASFFASYLLPMLMINYFLIFRNDRWRELSKQYRYHNGNFFLTYFLGSIGLIFIYFIVAFVIVKIL
jgi:hypothetical protein